MARVDLLASVTRAIANEISTSITPAMPTHQGWHMASQTTRLMARLIAEAEYAPDHNVIDSWHRLLSDLSLLAARHGVDLGGPGFTEPDRDSDDGWAPLSAISGAIEDRLVVLLERPSFLAELGTVGSAEEAWFGRTAAAMREFTERREQALPRYAERRDADSGVTSTTPTDGVFDPVRMSTYLRTRFPELGEDPILAWRRVPGGKAKLTVILTIREGSSLPTTIALRRDLSSQTGASAADEIHLLEFLHSRGLAVPQPLLAESDPSHLDGAFLVSAALPGARAAGESFPELRGGPLPTGLLPEIADQLAALHSLQNWPRGLQVPAPRNRGSFDTILRTYFDLWRALAARPPMSLGTILAFAWLFSHPLPGPRPVSIVHGDFGPHNVLVDSGGAFAAIVDWELAHIGDPASDLGFCRRTFLRAIGTWEEFVRRYLDAGGPPQACEEQAVATFGVWGRLRSSVLVAILYDLFARGQRTDLECASTYRDQGERTHFYLMRELSDLLELAATAQHAAREVPITKA